MNRVLVASVLLALPSLALADWRQFRGNDSNGIAKAADGPASLDKIAWKVELPGRGVSGPIVVGDKVFVTASSGTRQDKLHVLTFEREGGEPLWERKFWATGRTMTHPKMCVATPTPVSDGERVFAFYSSNDVACLDLEGRLLWYRGLTHDYPNASNSLGMASSPVLAGDTLVVQVESDAEAFTVGLDVATGVERWKLKRPRRANWTSPIVMKGQGRMKTVVLLQSSKGIAAVEPMTGKTVWEFTEGASTIPSSVIEGGVAYVPSKGITALRPNAESSSPEIVWQSAKLTPSTASPIAHEGKIYTLNRSGSLSCGDGANGERVWQLRLKGGFSGTPVIAGDRMFVFNEKGLGQVVDLSGEKGKIAGSKDLGETILCTPAISDGHVFVRSDGHLWSLR